jgi:hypothetical protein
LSLASGKRDTEINDMDMDIKNPGEITMKIIQ